MRFKLFGISVLIVIAFIWNSCQEATAPEMNPAIASPSNVELSITGSTVSSSWEFSAEKPVEYLIAQLATDDDFQNIIERDTLQVDTNEVSFEDAAVSLQYYFRIRAITPNRATSSHFATQQLELPNLTRPVSDSEIDGSSAVIKWDQPEEGTMTRIELTSETGTSTTIELTQEEVNNRSVTLENLMEGTEYTAVMYAEDRRVGLVTFRTVDTSAIITINDQEELYKSLHRAVDIAVAGDTIHVKGEHEFTADGPVSINKPLIIEGVEDPGNPPILNLDHFELTGNVSSFVISELELKGIANHAVDVSTATQANVTFKKSNVSGFAAGIFYASSDASATYSLLVDSTTVHNIGDQGGDVVDMRGGTLARIELRNSTFWDLGRRLLYIGDDIEYTGNNTEGGEEYTGYDAGDPPTITNCTIDNVASEAFVKTPAFNKYVIHVNNSILTNLRSEGSEIGLFSNGYANGNNTFGTNQGGFFADWDYWNHLDFKTATNILHKDPMYADPANGDFTVGNQTLIDSTWGDPRWLPN